MEDRMYTWVETHKQLTQYLSNKEDNQNELIQLLKSVGISPFNDKAVPGEHNIELDEIDPFTFFCYIYKYGPDRRLKYLQNIAKKLNISIPTDEKGIPSAQAQKVWLFPYKYLRNNNEVSRLWSFFYKALSNTISNADFEDVMNIRSTGKTKLTEALFYINPEKYLPINGPTKPFIKEKLNIDSNFSSFSEYENLLNKIRISTDIPFYELSYEAWKWNNNSNMENFWVFQGNPKFYDIVGSLREGALKTWSIAAHKDKIKKGDKVILWVTGDQAGCYALCEVISEISKRKDYPLEEKFYIGKSANIDLERVEIEIKYNLFDKPVLKDSLKYFPEFTDFKGGNQGTNFTATKEQYEKILEMINNTDLWVTEEEFKMIELIRKIKNEKAIIFHFKQLDELISHFQLENSDVRIVFSTPKGSNNLPVTISHRYILATSNENFSIILPNSEKNEIKGLIGYIDSGSFEKFGKESDPPIWSRLKIQDKLEDSLKELWFECISAELNRFANSNFNRFDNTAYRKAAFDKHYREHILQIAFSGKKMKLLENSKENESINIPQNLILYGPPGTGKTFELIKTYRKFFSDKTDGKSKEVRYEMITFHQSYSYEEFIEGIRPGFDEEEELRYKIEPGIFLRIAEKARKDSENNYAIFIDEINRGNISKIFGELITLIESDKRQGGENELEVILPYSKSKFSVPSNLYIIGTMNTADRSIALIDTALRRRFCFKEMMPDSSLLNDDVEEINLQLLLSKINERIEFLLDRDHTIGHSFFMKTHSKNEICAVFKNKIIPLLQEYFYNDWEKVQLILGDNKSWGKAEEQKLVRVKKHYDLSAEKELFGSDIEDFEDEIIYEINPALESERFDDIPVESFIHIYQKPGKAIL